MTYQETLDYLFSIEKYGIKLGLERIRDYTDALGNPQDKYPTIHIAGTNGKGSTAAMLQSILSSAGYKVGLLTSPHLVDYSERMRINYNNCDRDYIIGFVNENMQRMKEIPVSFFEITTALAFQYFAVENVDFGVIEVGMGGRLDATNIIVPEVSIITNIDYDHTKSLGNTLERIAVEKAGITKPEVPCITGAQDKRVQEAIGRICNENRAEFIPLDKVAKYNIRRMSLSGSYVDIESGAKKYENIFINLPGRHQIENALGVIKTVELLRDKGHKITDNALYEGFEKIKWNGRIQVFSRNPLVLMDVAHNVAGAKTLRRAIMDIIPRKKLTVVFGVLAEKDFGAMLTEYSSFISKLIITKPISERAADPEEVAFAAEKLGLNYEIIPSPGNAYRKAISDIEDEGAVLVTGSHYTVGEAIMTSNGNGSYR